MMRRLIELMEPEDYDEVRGMAMGNFDFVPTDDEIRIALGWEPRWIAVASEWGWNDTEVRDALCGLLERAHQLRT